MKALAGIVGALVGLSLVALVGYLVVPRLVAGSPGAPLSGGAAPASGSQTGPPRPGQAVPTPVTSAEKLRQELTEKRVPFYRYLKLNWSGVIDRFAVTEDLDTLDVAVRRGDDATLADIVSRAIAPTARDYGFRRVRFLVPNPPGSVDPLHVTAEATCDPDGHWTIYQK